MAEVIEHGKTYRHYRCPSCNCLFSVTHKDEYSFNDGKLWIEKPATKIETFVNCPECGKKLLIRREKL